MDNKFSIIMPAYNSGKFIKESIESVISQTYENWELLVVNDASTDNTKYIVESFIMKDTRVKLINLSKNQGIANARNIGISKITGRYLSFLDSDDLWHSEKLQRQKEFMDRNNVVFCYSEYELINASGEKLNKTRKVPKSIEYQDLLGVNYIGCLTVVIDLKSNIRVEMPQLKHEDYATWLKILKENKIRAYGIKESLAYYRKTDISTSSNKIKTLGWTWRIYTEFLGYSKIRGVLLMLRFIVNTLKKNVL